MNRCGLSIMRAAKIFHFITFYIEYDGRESKNKSLKYLYKSEHKSKSSQIIYKKIF